MLEHLANLISLLRVPPQFGAKSKADPEAARASEFARIREDRRAALQAFANAIDARDTRLQRSTQLRAIQATNAALRGGR